MKTLCGIKEKRVDYGWKICARGLLLVGLMFGCQQMKSQEFLLDAPTTLNETLQNLGEKLLKGKTGSIVAINPTNGEIICLATNSPEGPDDNLAIGKAYAPGSTIKPANALAFLAEGIVSPATKWACYNGYRNGNIKVGCHKHPSPLMLEDAIAISCNTWFLKSYMAMLGNRKKYSTKENAVTVWNEYMRSMGLGGPLGVDMEGERGGLLANVNYLSRRYENGWIPATIMWVGMGQGDITVTPLQLCNLAVSIANRGYFYTPHIHRDCDWNHLPGRYRVKHHTKVPAAFYAPIVEAMRKVVTKGTATGIDTPLYPICGKTGTAENDGKDHSAFMGFAPMNNPKIAIAVYIEHGGWGADVAAPIASLIMEEYLKGRLSGNSKALAKKIIAKATNAE